MHARLSPAHLDELDRQLAEAPTIAGADEYLLRAARRATGAYFTPWPLVRFVVTEVLQARFASAPIRWSDDGTPRVTILDPAAGDGRFLEAALDELCALATQRGATAGHTLRSAIAHRCLVGFERDRKFAQLARARFDGDATIYCAEALVDAPALPPVDVVLGNPPYARSINLARTDPDLWSVLRGRYEATSTGEWDLYAAFLEQSLDWINPEVGEVGLVVPSRWMTAANSARLRTKFAEARAVRAVVDFGARQLFSGATTYISATFLSRRPRANITVLRHDAKRWTEGSFEQSCLGAAPWNLATGARATLIEQLRQAGPRLGDVARVAKGTGTNADKVFTLALDAGATPGGSGLLYGFNRHRNARIEVEAELVRYCYRGRDVRTESRKPPALGCITPYDSDGNLFDASEMTMRFPMAFQHFTRCRERLDAREGGRFRGDKFYRFGRPQNLKWHARPDPKVIIPDVTRCGRALVDTRGAMVLDSAYALRPHDVASVFSTTVLAAVLSSPIVAIWLGATGVPLRGGYLRMKTAYLEPMPLPADSSRFVEIEQLFADGEIEHAHELVREAYGIAKQHWRVDPN